MTRRDFIERAEDIGRRMGEAEFDLCVVEVSLEQVEADAAKLLDRRARALQLQADAIKRHHDAVDDLFALRRERDAFEASFEDDERAAIEGAA